MSKNQGTIISKTFLQALSGHLNGFYNKKPSFWGFDE